MQVKIFTIPILGGDDTTEELNRFLRSKKNKNGLKTHSAFDHGFGKVIFLAWGYRIKILLRCDFFRYDALRLPVSTPGASFRNFARSWEQNIRNLLGV
jgi:hypothetical protein